MTVAYARIRASLRRGAALLSVAVALLVLGALTGVADAATKYKVRVDSAPQGATVYVGSKDKGAVGVTPWEGSLPKGSHKIIVELDGYLPAEKTVKIARTRKLQEVFIPLVKKAEPPRIDVRADADKNVFGAIVFLDGQSMGAAPTLLTTVPGRHQVQLKKDGYETFETWVEVKENEKATLTPVLKEIEKPKLGTIVVEADVPDAEVYLDGNLQPDRTPTVISGVIEGLHIIEVRKEPAIPWKQTVQVEANKQVKVRAELKSTIGGQGGAIRVLSNVQGAHVFLDGTDMGAVPVDIKDVKPGEHVIEVRAAGYQTREERVTVNAGSSTVLKLDLNAEAKTEAIIKVVSPVPGADVYIDGASAGKVPVEQAVSTGEHYVIVKLDGYKTFETKLRIEAGQTQTVSAELRAVGKLRVLSDPLGATVYINGMPQDKKTPLELDELDVGETEIRVVIEGRVPYVQVINVVGGATEVISANLPIIGPSEEDKLAEQRGLSSFGARTLPRGRSTIDLGVGYPYFTEIAVKVGAGKAGDFGFDAGVGVRSMGARSELGLGVRFMLVDADPFSAGAFTNLWWGSKLFDESKRNGATWDAGVLASLTALTHVTVTGRLYLDMWSDRHCPAVDAGAFDGDGTEACDEYLAYVNGGSTAPTELTARMEELTGESGTGMFGRENGLRVMTSVIAEISYSQRWNIWFMLEGAPFQGERALFTDPFTRPMLASDYGTYMRAGVGYKF